MHPILLVGFGGFVGAVARYRLGGFTTFSAFGLDAVHLLRRRELATAALYAGGSVLLGIAAVWLGLKLVGLAAH